MILNKVQQDIVDYGEGPILIVAGAGTGKTRTITQRIQRLVSDNPDLVDKIVCVTFTNKAARELQQRIGSYMPWCGTFHGIACKILRGYLFDGMLPITSNFTIADSYDQRKLIKNVVDSIGINYYDAKALYKECYAYISARKNNTATPPNDELESIYQKYNAVLSSNNTCDFDDLIIYATQVMDNNKALRDKFQYIFVDEYQDVNYMQYKFVRSFKNNNVCCVGDDDQSIYQWRGSEYKYMHKFEKEFDNVKVFKLEENYRSANTILDAAFNVINNNTQRIAKQVFSQNAASTFENDNIVQVYEFENKYMEESFIINFASRYGAYKNIAILCRTSFQIKMLHSNFISQGINAHVNKNRNIFEKPDIRAIIAYLQLITNDRNTIALATAMQYPKIGIGKKNTAKIMDMMQNGSDYYEIADGLTASRKASFINLYHKIQSFKDITHDVVYHIAKHSNIVVLEEIEKINDMVNQSDSIEQFLEYASISSTDDESSDAMNIQIMTIHESKGREFDIVITPYWVEGILPHALCMMNNNGIEEERRLAYVALTRAKEAVVVTCSGDQSTPSRFIHELDVDIKMNLY